MKQDFIYNRNLPNLFTEEDIKDLCGLLSQDHNIIYLDKFGERVLKIHRDDPRYKSLVNNLWLNRKLKRTLSINQKTQKEIAKV